MKAAAGDMSDESEVCWTQKSETVREICDSFAVSLTFVCLLACAGRCLQGYFIYIIAAH